MAFRDTGGCVGIAFFYKFHKAAVVCGRACFEVFMNIRPAPRMLWSRKAYSLSRNNTASVSAVEAAALKIDW